MNKRLKPTAQGGFTLIELIVVIVILGILAATALPKFASLGGDARMSTLAAARGSLNSVVAMAHGKALLGTPSPINFEGTSVALVNGYPAAAKETALAAGLDVTGAADFTFVGPGNTDTTLGPATSNTAASTQFAIVPTAVKSTGNAKNCYVMFTQAANSTTPPTVVMTATADNCQ